MFKRYRNMTMREHEEDLCQQLREMFPEDAVMSLEPLLKSLENDRRIHPISCEEAIVSVILDLKNKGTQETFYETWNVVSHIEECGRRSCKLLRAPNHMTKYLYPGKEELDSLIGEVRDSYELDVVGNGRAKNGQEGREMFDKLMESLQ